MKKTKPATQCCLFAFVRLCMTCARTLTVIFSSFGRWFFCYDFFVVSRFSFIHLPLFFFHSSLRHISNKEEENENSWFEIVRMLFCRCFFFLWCVSMCTFFSLFFKCHFISNSRCCRHSTPWYSLKTNVINFNEIFSFCFENCRESGIFPFDICADTLFMGKKCHTNHHWSLLPLRLDAAKWKLVILSHMLSTTTQFDCCIDFFDENQ